MRDQPFILENVIHLETSPKEKSQFTAWLKHIWQLFSDKSKDLSISK